MTQQRRRPAASFLVGATGLFTHNLGLKFVSLVLACALWFHVNLSSQDLVHQQFHIPVELFNVTEAELDVSVPERYKRVAVTVRGRRSDLIFRQENIHVGVNLKNIRSPLGEVLLPVETVVPSYFELQSVEPQKITVLVRMRSPP